MKCIEHTVLSDGELKSAYKARGGENGEVEFFDVKIPNYVEELQMFGFCPVFKGRVYTVKDGQELLDALYQYNQGTYHYTKLIDAPETPEE